MSASGRFGGDLKVHPMQTICRWLAALCTVFTAVSAPATGFTQPAVSQPPSLRTYSDDPLLASQLLTVDWHTPRDGAFDILALSGGGPNGAFGAGMLTGWTARGDRPEFDHVTGVSTGALIAPFAYLGSDWDGALKDAYLDERSSRLMRRRMLSGLFASSLYSGEPLRALVDSYVTQELVDAVAEESHGGRTLIIVTTDLDAQRSVAWDMGAVARLGGERARLLFRNVMIASSSIPGLFPPVMLDAGDGAAMHVDGGIAAPIYAVPEALANRTDAAIVKRAPVRLYMVVNISVAPVADQTDYGAFAILRRSLATSGKASMRSVLQMNAVMAARYGAQFSVMSIPAGQSAPLTDFSPETMDRLFRLGEQQAAANRWRTSVDDPEVNF